MECVIRVLILIVVEDGLVPDDEKLLQRTHQVLILIVVEDGLVQRRPYSSES